MKIMPTVFISAYANAPKGTKLTEDGSLLGVMLEIDRTSNIVVETECMFITSLAQGYYRKLIVGRNFINEFEDIINTIEANLIIPSARALVVALRIAHQRYVDTVLKGDLEKQ